MIKRRVCFAMAVIFSLTAMLSACSGSAGSSGNASGNTAAASSEAQQASGDNKIVIKLGHTGNEKQKYHDASLKFKELVEERSNGKFQVDVYPKTLGGDRELMEALQIGTADFAEINTAVLATVSPSLGVLDLPYIFVNREHAYRVLDGEIGQKLLDETSQKSGLIGLDYWENGFRCFTNNVRPIKEPADLKDITMRAMQNNIHLETFKLWGANPTPMEFSEMVTAMQQGVIEGHDNAPDTIAANSMWEYQSYFSESSHFYAAIMFAASPVFWNSLSEDEKTMFKEISQEVRDFERQLALEQFNEGIDTLEKNGMNVTRNDEVDVDAFKESVRPIWDKYAETLGADLIDSIANN